MEKKIYADSRESMPVINPSTEAVIGELPIATPDDLNRAIDASVRAHEV